MEKVKITQEQADAIKKMGALSNHRKGKFVEEHVLKNWNDGQRGLQGLTTNELIRALYIGYEVEPEFKVGDWVKSRHGIGTGKITKIDDMEYYTDFGMIAALDDIRHATPQETATEKARRWWAKHDREVWEIKDDDLISNLYEGIRSIYMIKQGEYLIDEGARWLTLDEIKENWIVACFAEDRKDI